MKIAVLLTDNKSLNEKIILKSYFFLKKSRINKFYFLGCKKKFNKIYSKFKNQDKFVFKNIYFNEKKPFEYLNNITLESIKLLKEKKIYTVINMPLNKKKFFKNKYIGFTEFFSDKLGEKNMGNMLLYNEKLSVLPLTTHLNIKEVSSSINKKKIKRSLLNINNFYKNIIKKEIHIDILGLNPHAGIDNSGITEEKKIIVPAIKESRKRFKNIEGPHSADTIFIKKSNHKKRVIIGMYHDQVLPVFKTLFGFNGINITIGLKYLRLTPDHGTGDNIVKKNQNINNKSFLYCIKFCEKYISS